MVKTLVWGYPKEFSAIIDRLIETRAIDARVWIGTEKHCHYSRKNFMEKDLHFPFKSPVRCPDFLYDAVSKDFYTFLEMENRRNVFNYFYEHTMHDFLDYFQQQLNFFYHLLTSKEIELVLIDKITHYGEDWILYSLAKAMNLKTILLFPSHFPERFFYVFDVDDFGYFREIPTLESCVEEIPESSTRLDLYMKYIGQIKPTPYTFWNALNDRIRHGQRQAFYKWRRYRCYQKNLQAIIEPQPDLNKPFVYFPLHLQPELTTFPLGDKFSDQVLAIETLCDLLPDDWFVYVKENAHQNEYMRGDGFFARLRNLPKVKMMPLDLSSRTLIDKAQFTATITGTAGWETINLGKKALAFGRPWYLTLPGVIKYHPGLQLDEILRYEFNQAELKTAVGNLFGKMGRGTIGRQFIKNIQFDREDNARIAAESLSRVIRACMGQPVETGS